MGRFLSSGLAREAEVAFLRPLSTAWKEDLVRSSAEDLQTRFIFKNEIVGLKNVFKKRIFL